MRSAPSPTRETDLPAVVERTEAYEILRGGAGDARVVLTCEHATNRLPEGYRWPAEDRWLVNTHWAIDLGIAQITRALADELGAMAVLSRFSRLLVDPNRHHSAQTLFREVADGRFVGLNQGLDEGEKRQRLDTLYHPYHQAIDDVMSQSDGCFLLSLHSFTPVYEGAAPRWMEVGILFDEEDKLAAEVEPAVRAHGLVTALNEPYTGKGGLMYAAHSHAERHGWRTLEIEIRQDRAANPAYKGQLVRAMADLCRTAIDAIDDPPESFTEEVQRVSGRPPA